MLTHLPPRHKLWLVVAVAALLRLPGLWWGLPGPGHLFSYHPDEFHSLRGLFALTQGDLNPHFFNYGCLYLYLVDLAGCLVHPQLASGPGVGEGLPQYLPRALRAWTIDARLVSLVAGLLTVLLVGWAAQTLGEGGWAAALVLAVMPLHALHCRYGTVDATLGLWVAGVMFLAARAAVSERPVWYVAAGAAVGLAASTKYPGALALLIPWAAVLLHPGLSLARRALLLLGCLGVAAVAFACTSPYVLLAWPEARQDILFELRHMRVGEYPARLADPWGWWFHLKWLVVGTGGLAVVGLVGLVRASLSRSTYRLWLPWGLFCAAWFVLIARAGVRYARYELPLLPAMAVACAGWVSGQRRRWLTWAALVLLGLTTAHCLYLGVRLCQPDSRDLALRTILQHSGPHEIVALVWEPWFQSPPLDYCNGGQALRHHPLWGAFSRPLRPLAVIGYDPARLRAVNWRWFVVSEVEIRGYMRVGSRPVRELMAEASRASHQRWHWNSGWPGPLVPLALSPPDDWLYPCMPIYLYRRASGAPGPAGRPG
jgi:hypothetical protein